MSRFLYVEDEYNPYHLLELAMNEAGHTLISAPDLETAVEVFDRERPDGVIIDYLLGVGGTGGDVYRRLRDRPAFRCVFLTGFKHLPSVTSEIKALGVPDGRVFGKSGDLPQLVQRICDEFARQGPSP